MTLPILLQDMHVSGETDQEHEEGMCRSNRRRLVTIGRDENSRLTRISS